MSAVSSMAANAYHCLDHGTKLKSANWGRGRVFFLATIM